MNITEEQKQDLLSLAKGTIQEHLGLEHDTIPTLDSVFKEKSGLFVTLQKNNTLRGCIGSLSDHQSIIEGVQNHALNAAFHDHRFKPVAKDELDEITIEISILTKPTPLEFNGATELLQKLKPLKDGVTLYYGNNSATFLPQVWEQLPDPEQFLNHLCQKAGLSQSAWKEDGIKIDIYSVIKF